MFYYVLEWDKRYHSCHSCHGFTSEFKAKQLRLTGAQVVVIKIDQKGKLKIKWSQSILAIDVRDVLKLKQSSSQLNLQKSCQGNCQVHCAPKSKLCDIKFSSRQLSCQLSGKKIFHIFC